MDAFNPPSWRTTLAGVRRFAPLLFAAAFSSAHAAEAPPAAVPAITAARASLSADAEARWIPFDLTPGNQIRFTMTLDGSAVVAVLDTGVSYSVLARRYAAANRLPLRGAARASVIGGSVPVSFVATQSLAMGGYSRSGGTLTVADLPAAATGSAQAVDLLVGRDLTAAYALDIDYSARRFRLLPSGRLPFAGTSSPLAIAPGRQVYVSNIVLGGAALTPVVVDTGDGSSVTLSATAWSAARQPPRASTTTVSFGLGGPVVSDMGIVPALVVGRTIARNVEVRVEPAGGFSETIGVAGRVGSAFLQHYRVLLDPTAGHMVLAPGPTADALPLRSTSGLLLGLTGDRLKVLHVMRGGPAEAGGWRNGDLICSVDGSAVNAGYAASPAAAWSTGAPGRTIRLTLCDGTVRPLTLRAFY